MGSVGELETLGRKIAAGEQKIIAREAGQEFS
jgi:hypothetical protein